MGNEAGDLVTSWVNPLSLVLGALFVATGAYLSAVFLVSESPARRGRPTSSGTSSTVRSAPPSWPVLSRSPVSIVLHRDGRFVFDGLKGDALPLVIVSFVCGIAVLVLLRRGVQRGARVLAVGAVVAVIWAWGVAQHPYLLPQVLTIDAAAAPGATLTAVLIVFGIAVVVVAAVAGAAVHARAAQPRRGDRAAGGGLAGRHEELREGPVPERSRTHREITGERVGQVEEDDEGQA